ncbi:MAG TPA: hypothetical protein VFO08_08405 [Methylomirabilota bacterium]|nr:hypothetical protein [Methylomirabilota bacterium]
MRILRRYLAVSLLLCVVCAVYLTARDVALPDVSRIDRAIKEAEPRQEASENNAFTTTIKGYTYTLTPRAEYEIAGLVVSQHRSTAAMRCSTSTTRPIPATSGTSASSGVKRSRTGRTGR